MSIFMRAINKDGTEFTFTDEEMRTVLMYAFGYAYLGSKGHLPISFNNDTNEKWTREKLLQCFEGDFIIHEKLGINTSNIY